MISAKGQFNVEFFTVLILFIAFASYFSLRILDVTPSYTAQVNQAIIRSESYRISEAIINDYGYPENWETLSSSVVKKVGLLDMSYNKTNMVSFSKITKLEQMCGSGSNYAKIKSLIGADNDFSIMLVEKPTGEVLIECGTPVTSASVASTKRLVAFDSDADGSFEYGELIVQVW